MKKLKGRHRLKSRVDKLEERHMPGRTVPIFVIHDKGDEPKSFLWQGDTYPMSRYEEIREKVIGPGPDTIWVQWVSPTVPVEDDDGKLIIDMSEEASVDHLPGAATR